MKVTIGYSLLIILISMFSWLQSQSAQYQLVDNLSMQIVKLRDESKAMWTSMHTMKRTITFDTKVSVVKDFQKKLQTFIDVISSMENAIKQLPDEEFKKIRAINRGIFQNSASVPKEEFYQNFANAKKKLALIISMLDKVIDQAPVVYENFNKASVNYNDIEGILGGISRDLYLTFVR